MTPPAAAAKSATPAQTPPAPPAQPAPEIDEQTQEASRQAAKLKAEGDALRRDFKPDRMQDDALNDMRQTLERIVSDVQTVVENQQPRVAELTALRDRLGPAPAKDQPAEPEERANERKSLTARLDQASRPVQMAEGVRLEANALLERINRQRRILFANRLMERVGSPLSPSLWRNMATEAQIGLTRLSAIGADWRYKLLNDGNFYLTLVISAAIWLLTSAAAVLGINRFRTWDGAEGPPFWKRASSAAWVVIFTALPPVATAASFYFSLAVFDLMDGAIDKIASAAFGAVCVVASVNALAVTLLAPGRPQWRIFAASRGVASRIRFLAVGMAGVYGLDLVLSAVNEVLAAPLVLVMAQSVIASVAFAVLGLFLFLMPSNSVEVEGSTELRWLSLLRVPFVAATLAILVCALVGYVPLARFLATQIVVTGTILITLYLVFIGIDAFAESLEDDASRAGRRLASLGLSESRRAQLGLPVMLVLKVLAFCAAVPLVLLQVGFDSGDVHTMLSQAFFGFEIGTFHVSLASLAGALTIFFIAYTLAHLFQDWLDGRVLAKAGLSGSARDSIRTTVGYGGVIAAALAAASAAGVNFSNLAIVAGALSVGVGLGLQGIVNNFVSGLVLLAERPIRVGDWVEAGSEEGIVRKINFRATEIETFDRAVIVIPNSALISGNVKNWTLNNDTGRVTIPVSVAVGSDPEEVRDILARVAKEHMEVLTSPAPIVYFSEFTAMSLDFKLYVYLLNINRSFAVRTDLRIAILKAFKEANIQIPHTQLDIFIRDFHGTAMEIAKQLAQNPAAIALTGVPSRKDPVNH